MDRKTQIATLLLKHAGLAGDTARGLVAAGKGFLGSGKHVSKVMAEHGVQSPLAHAAAKLAPYAVAAGGAKAAYESPTGQKLRYRWALHKQRQAMKRQQRGY
jgi:hypothetical protein